MPRGENKYRSCSYCRRLKSIFVVCDFFEQTATLTRQSKMAYNTTLMKKPYRRSEVVSEYRYKTVLFIYRAEDYSRVRIHVLPVKHSSPTRYAYSTAAGARNIQPWPMSTASSSVRWSCVPMLQFFLTFAYCAALAHVDLKQ